MAEIIPQWHFKIQGMDCAEEVSVLQREIGPLVGGADHLNFDVLNAKMTASPATEVTYQQIIDAVSRTGMRAEPWRSTTDPADADRFWPRWERPILTIASGLATLGGFLVHYVLAGELRAAFGTDGAEQAHTSPVVVKLLYAVAIVAGVWVVLPKAWLSLRRARPDMNLLMTIAVVGAVAIGDWLEAATVSFLFAFSLLLESWSVNKARRAISELLDLTPSLARVRQVDGTEVEMSPNEVPVGALVIVKPGERIPLDGRVREGTSQVNQAPITGESLPIAKNRGDEVFAGTINGDGALLIECLKDAGHTTLANIIRMVEDAHSRRAPSEQWVERFAQVYTPVVMGLSVVVFLVPLIFFGRRLTESIYHALVLLVIACPCALVISTPVSIVAALAAAARQGVLIKGGMFVEMPAKLKAIAFDKTGTLTAGKPTVVEVVALSGHDEREVLERAASMEALSEHPLAHAILAYAKQMGVSHRSVEEFQVIQGKGATAKFDGRLFWIGSHRYLHERGQETGDVHERLERLSNEGRSVVVLGNADHVCGLIAVADPVRPSARAILAELRSTGIEHLVMLTGDNEATARAVAAATGVDEFRSELLPQDKVEAIDALVKRYGSVAMIGDGVNDAPALARATFGIAMGAVGSDAAIETADIALMSDDLSRLPWLVHHSRRTLRVIHQNIAFALSVKAVFVALTLFGTASLWSAIAADMGASVLVIFNGLRLLGEKRVP